MNNAHTPQRLHALDNLRALMMWLGIVLHAALNAATSLAALASYQLLVRRTPLGTLLNGRRAEKRSAVKPASAGARAGSNNHNHGSIH